MNLTNSSTRAVLATVFTLIVTGSCFSQEMAAFAGRVVMVDDGDMITVTDMANIAYKIRLAGIDAPEPGQDFSAEAKKYLSDLLLDKPITVVGRRSGGEGMLIAQVFLLGRDVSYSMIWAGLAWHDRDLEAGSAKEDRRLYADGEKFARGTKEKIWSDPKPVAPWEFRKLHPVSRSTEKIIAPEPAVGSPRAGQGGAVITLTPVEIVGNKDSKIYHWNPGCPGFSKVAEKKRVAFDSIAQAEAAGYRPAKNCKQPAAEANSSRQ